MKKRTGILSFVMMLALIFSLLVGCNKASTDVETTDTTQVQGTEGFPTLKINGVALNNYTVVYDNNANSGEQAFSYFNQKIGELYGVTLQGSTEIGEGYEILLGLDNSDETIAAEYEKNPDGVIGVSGNKIILLGINYGALSQVIDSFLEKADGTDTNKEILVTECEAADVKKDFLKVMSYNVLYDMKKEGREANCRSEMVSTILGEAPDVFGTQENNAEHHKFFTENLPEYSSCLGADETLSNYIYWKTDKFNLIKKGYFYMSDTPAVRSKYEGSNSYRSFTYVILEVKETGKQFLFIDVHTDYHAEESVRVKQLAALTSLLPKINKNNLPMIILGDFNTTPTKVNGAVPYFLKDNPTIGMTSEVAQSKGDTGGTLAVSGFTKRDNRYIFDYILVTTDKIYTQYYSVVNNIKNGKYPSDHLPVTAEIIIY